MQDSIDVLTSSAVAALRQLFLQGPTWDGNIVSKMGRNELVKFGYAFRVEGWASLTVEGVMLAATSGFDHEKERLSR